MSQVKFRTASGEVVRFKTKKRSRKKKPEREYPRHIKERIRATLYYDVMPGVEEQRRKGYSQPLSEHRTFEAAKKALRRAQKKHPGAYIRDDEGETILVSRSRMIA